MTSTDGQCPEAAVVADAHRDNTQPLCIALVGHQGRMGVMLMQHWLAAGYTVRGADCMPGSGSAHDSGGGSLASPNLIEPEALREAVAGADAIVLCVPAKALSAVLAAIAPYLDSTQVLLDITSVKIIPMQQMEAVHHGPVVGTHPLFGPVSAPEDRIVALTPGARAQAEHISLAQKLFTVFGCRTFCTTAEEHDRGVAFVQGLNFISSAAYFASLAHREDVLPFLTPSFRRRLEGTRKLLTEDAAMFQGFTSANPMTADAIHTFRLFLDLVEGGGLPDVVKRARWWYERQEE